MIYNPLNFPTSTIVAQTVPKNAFYKRAKPQRATALKDFLTTTFERITWLYKLHPDTLHITDGRQVHEIDVFLCTLKGTSYDERLLSEIDALLPRQTIYMIEQEGLFDLLMQYKAVSEQGIIKPNGLWERLSKVDLSTSPLRLGGYDMDALYADFLGQLSQLGTLSEADYQKASELKRQAERLKKQCETLQKKKRQERQYNLRLEIGRDLKQQQTELAKLEEEIEIIKNKIR
ncbi:DUF4391 domain-containing protein [Capnocytophaga canimorsus]|uniref:DUF4391 domain-containing protein n=1 Tax=Capnocytophaga canimorsus TaxID=28188 RepID=A0A0B7IJK4_9FLAO|nr:DUF4391 domain-containing protein [Capnocytophaga canimorsus]CEN50167.1 conserved hypothetical protein [Capnocytophaga canimorsus]